MKAMKKELEWYGKPKGRQAERASGRFEELSDSITETQRNQ